MYWRSGCLHTQKSHCPCVQYYPIISKLLLANCITIKPNIKFSFSYIQYAFGGKSTVIFRSNTKLLRMILSNPGFMLLSRMNCNYIFLVHRDNE